MRAALLDTHAFLWFLFDDPRLSDRAAELIEEPEPQNLLSAVSLWEIAIKHQLGKLTLGMPYEFFVERYVRGAAIEVIGVDLPHLLAYESLPLQHRDPFDRMLVAQAVTLGVSLITADAAFEAYEIDTVW